VGTTSKKQAGTWWEHVGDIKISLAEHNETI
jgi:hypothetical protein